MSARIERQNAGRRQPFPDLAREDSEGEAAGAGSVVRDEERTGGLARASRGGGGCQVDVVGDGAVFGGEEELALKVGGPGNGVE